MLLSVLTLARRRSKFLSHYILNFLNTVEDLDNIELLVMASANDDWNEGLFKFFKGHKSIKFFFEDSKLGGYGRHIFFNELAKKTKGDWILHTCDDQMFIIDNWDTKFKSFAKNIDHKKANIVIPRFDNTGYVDHFLSRGFYTALGRMGGYPNIDTWINHVSSVLPKGRIRQTPFVMMHDFTPDTDIDTPDHLLTDVSVGQKNHIPWEAIETQDNLKKERIKLREAIINGL
jgi:hypothetical protein